MWSLVRRRAKRSTQIGCKCVVLMYYKIACERAGLTLCLLYSYGFSDKVNLIFSISTGYFMWDTYTIATRRFMKRDPQMLVHSVRCYASRRIPSYFFYASLQIVCSFTYLFGQFPFLHYYGVRFLLFELSSIPLQLRQLLILLEYDKVRFSVL